MNSIRNFVQDTSGAMTMNFTVLAASLIGLGLGSVAVVSLGASNLGAKFEDGVTGAGTVVLCMFSNQNDCAGGGDGNTGDDGQDATVDGFGGTVTIGSTTIDYTALILTEQEANQLANEMRLYSADQVKGLIEQIQYEFYMSYNSGDMEGAAKMLDYYHLAVQVLSERDGYESDAETAAGEFLRAIEYYESGREGGSFGDLR